MLTLAAYQFDFFAVPNLIVALATLLWGLLLRWRESDSSAGTWDLAVAVSVAVWQVAYALGYMSREPAIAQQWIVVGQLGIVFIGPCLYEQLRRLLGLRDWRNRLSVPAWLAAAGFLYVLLGTDSFLGAPYRYAWGYYAHYALGGTVLSAYLCAMLVFLFACCVQTWHVSPIGSGRRHRARILWIGFGVAFTAAIDFLPCWGFAVYPFGYLMVAFTVVTVGYAAWRYRLVAVNSRAAAEQVLKSLSDGVLVLDDLGLIALANDRATVLLGRDRDALLGQPIEQVLPATGEYEPLAAIGAADAVHTEIELAGTDGARRILDVTVNIMRNDYGDVPLTVYALQDVTRYREAADRIRELVYFDQATGLPNRRHLYDKLGQCLRQASRDQTIAVCGLRLEHVRHLADLPAGQSADPVLDEIAVRLQAFMNAASPAIVTAARIQSHEFVLLFERVDAVGKVITQLNQLNQILRAPVTVGSHVTHPALWLGISLYPNDGDSVDALLKRATAAMDQAAETGDESAHFFNADANSAALQALALDTRLARAIEEDELRPYFQPVINTSTGAIEYAEALVRWHDPVRGLRLPDEFVPVAEQSGLIVALDRWMLAAACRQAAMWRGQDGAPAPRVAVNISGAHFASVRGASIADTVSAVLASTGLAPSRLELEITETRAVTTDESVLDNLRRLRELGVRIAVDDFGTGYASLNYLQQFPLDSLKVDRSYVMAIGRDQTRTALLKSILHLAQQLDLEVVAEGVEAPHQTAFLRRHGCHLVQGYLFCRPLPADEFVRFAENWTGHTDVTLRLLTQK